MSKSSDRILSIDTLKGFAGFMILIVHGVVFGIFTPDPQYFAELPTRVPLIFLILLAPIILMATFYPIFVMIVGLTVVYSYIRESQKEQPDYLLVAKRKLVNGGALMLLGSLYGPLTSHTGYNDGNFTYSLVTGFITNGGYYPASFSDFYHSTYSSIFSGIVYGIFGFTFIFHLIFTRIPKITDYQKLINTMIIMQVLFILLCFLLEYLIETNGSIPLPSQVFGGRHSMFPQFVFGFSGANYAIIMAQKNLPFDQKKKLVRKYGWGLSLVYFSIFLAIVIITRFDYVSMIAQDDLSILFQFGNVSMTMWIMSGFFELGDFAKTKELGIKRTKFLRTYAPLTMTIYCTESVFAASLRRVFKWIFGDDIFPWNGIVNVGFMIIILGFWYYLIKQWKKAKFVGSFEFGVVMIMKLFGLTSSRLQSNQPAKA